jgi:hypothetical protein
VAALRRHGQAPGSGAFEVRTEVPVVLHEVAVRLEQGVEVELLEPLHRRQGTDADVDGAVARREHPAVPRDRGAVLVLQRQTRFEVDIGVARGRGVGADRQAERLVGHPVGAELAGDCTLRAGGDHGEVGVDASAVRLDTGDLSVVADHGGGFGLVDDLRAGVDGGVHQGRVEAAAGPHRSVVGEATGSRPVEFAHLFAGDHP